MRVSLISVGPPYRGGISDLSALIHEELIKDHDLQFINFKRQYPAFLFPGKTEYKEGSQAVDMASHRIIDSINPLTWLKAARKITSNASEVAIFRYWNPFFAPLIYVMSLLLVRKEVKVAILVDNLIPHEESFIDSWMARLVLKRASVVFTMSRAVSTDVVAHNASVKCITLFHPLYEIYSQAYTKEAARKKLGLKSGPVAMYFGLIRPYKGLDILINALGHLGTKIKGLHTFILGEAYEDAEKYRSLISDLGLDKQVTFENAFVSDEDLPLYFAAADVLVLPYRTATQSGIVGISFQMDRPVIATQVGGLGEYITEGETGYLVPPENPEALAEAMELFFAGDDRDRMCENVNRDKQRFSIQSFCARLMDEVQND